MSYWETYYHIIWATKYREPSIESDIESILYPYLVQKCNEFETTVYALNGDLDHIHLALSIPPKYAVSQVIKGLKGGSSHYLNQKVGLPFDFHWQRGFGALTFSQKNLKFVKDYIDNQKTHRRNDSTIALLKTISLPQSDLALLADK